MSAMESDDWCIAVFKCKQDNIRSVLVDFYAYMKDVEGVKNQHFLIKDRVDDEVVFSYRVSVEPRVKEVIRSEMAYKLGSLLSEDKFVVDPSVNHLFEKYVAWSPKKRIDELGPKKFAEFCDFLAKMSKLVLQMVKKRYFKSNERVEIAHVMSWMLGCTEYGLLSPKGWEIGYYDRIEDKNCPYLKEQFPKS
jgi:hypothetical protein